MSAPAERYQAMMPPPWEAATDVRWQRYVARLVMRGDIAKEIARYGKALPCRYAAAGPPLSAQDLDPYACGIAAGAVLSRDWGADTVSLQCAADAIKRGPELLVATSDATAAVRAASVQVHATAAIYGTNGAAPIAFGRSYGEHDEQTAEVIARLLNTTTKVAKSCECAAPIVSCDLALADYLVGRLVGDIHPFAAAIAPDWYHDAITAWDLPPVLLANSPFELFVARGDHIHSRARVGRRPVEVIAMQYGGRPNGLFYVLVPDERRPFFLVRPDSFRSMGIHRQMAAAADLAVRATALYGVRPVDDLGLEHIFVSDDTDLQWSRHAAIVQAVLTFSLTNDVGTNGLEP